MTLAYHHHSFEFEPVNGKRPFDLLVERFDPKLVHWELDLFWVKLGGDDPAARLRQLKGRVGLVHLKDVATGSKTEYWEGAVPKTAFKEVGNGMLDWPVILKACAEAGVKHYIIEQDQCPGNPLDSVAQSYKFLRGVTL
jgi:sugar phosphate isomerase/epimerase